MINLYDVTTGNELIRLLRRLPGMVEQRQPVMKQVSLDGIPLSELKSFIGQHNIKNKKSHKR